MSILKIAKQKSEVQRVFNDKIMAIIKKGILGTISGKIGSVIYCNVNGKQIVRSLPSKNKRPPTIPQLAQQMRFILISSFFASLRTLVKRGHNGFSKCISYHLKNAIVGEFPMLEIDQAKVVLTRGCLCSAQTATVKSVERESIIFNWRNSGDPSDEAILVTYNATRQQHVWRRTSVTRISEMAQLTIPLNFSGQTLHCWIAFIARDGKQFSNSSYLGTVTAL